MSQPLPPEPDDDRPKGGFGAPIRKEIPKPSGDSKPTGAYGVTVGPDGKMRTTKDNLPRSQLEQAIWDWANAYNLDVEKDFLP